MPTILSPLIQTYTMEDWLIDVEMRCKGKLYKRTIGTQAHHTEDEALEGARNLFCSGRRSLPEGHYIEVQGVKDYSFKRPTITILSMKAYRRNMHPRHRRDTQDLSAFDILAKG